MGQRRVSEWGPIRSLLALVPVLVGAPLYTLYHQISLPPPNPHPYDPRTALPHPSETTILSYAKYLSEDIGYRIPGTHEHAVGDEWLLQKVLEITELCHKAVVKEPGRKLECTIWRQQGSGSHRFDIMSTRVYKTYVDLSNIILRISDGTDQSKSDTVLINAHLDSTLPSPGAADDALAVGVMLECARVLIETPGWVPTYAIIFLFNNAEESLQDGSHLYVTQHETAPTVRAIVNLEAAGTTGPELLFQATSEQMIKAYAHVPRPYGSICASEIFSSGILLSDTDFRQFEKYLNVTGLDMAIVGNSYMYHMRGDLVENIQPGVAQHMADNVLALLQYLSSDASPIPGLVDGFSHPRTVFFTTFHLFFVYSFTTAKILYVSLFSLSLVLLRLARVRRVWSGIGAVVAAVLGSVVGANVVAFVMQHTLKKPLSWFKAEYHPVLLYGPAAITGALLTQLLFNNGEHKFPTHTLERPVFASLLLFQSLLAACGQLMNIGSSAPLFLGSVGFFIALCVDTVLMRTSAQRFQPNGNAGDCQSVIKGVHQELDDGCPLSLWAYAIAMLIPLTSGIQLLASTLIVFVPLTGRMGENAPAEFIVASIVAVLGAFCLSFIYALAHRFSPHILRLVMVSLLIVLGVAMAFFYAQDPFDRQHQKRLFVVHKEDLVTREQHLHIAAADGTPGFENLVYEIASEFGVSGVTPKTGMSYTRSPCFFLRTRSVWLFTHKMSPQLSTSLSWLLMIILIYMHKRGASLFKLITPA